MNGVIRDHIRGPVPSVKKEHSHQLVLFNQDMTLRYLKEVEEANAWKNDSVAKYG